MRRLAISRLLVVFFIGGALFLFQGCDGEKPAAETVPVKATKATAQPVESKEAAPAEKAAAIDEEEPAIAPAPPLEKAEPPSKKIVRPSALAGSWYAGSREDLEGQVKELLAAATKPETGKGRVGALIAPHAGYRYSGRSQAACYKAVEGARYERVILLGPTHRSGFQGFSIAPVTHYETPLGEIPLDLKVIEELRRHPLHQADVDPRAHALEHSLEIELPFLQVAIGEFQLVPILVGTITAYDRTMIACALRPFVDETTLMVASSDFTHFGSRFGYDPFSPSQERLKELDLGAAQLALKGDADGFMRYRLDTGATICGWLPISILLSTLPGDFSSDLLSYTTSADLTGDYADSVSYVAIAFYFKTAREEISPLAKEEMERLVALARHSLDYGVKNGNPPPEEKLKEIFPPTPRILQRRGVFVTLKVNGVLRGCIGRIFPSDPIYRATSEMAVAAALHDSRFKPVTEDELSKITVEVSALTPPRLIGGPEEVRVGTDGVVLYKGRASAVFLPQVATEQGWNRETYLSRLARKAGLSSDAWKEGASFMTFQAEIAHEDHRGK